MSGGLLGSIGFATVLTELAASLLVGLAAALSIHQRSVPRIAGPVAAGVGVKVLLALGALLVAWSLPANVAGVALIACGAGGGFWALWRRRIRRRTAASTAAEVAAACGRLASQLGAGQPPGLALAEVAEECPAFRSAADAFYFGAEVPTALRESAAVPGAGQLRLVAAAWQASYQTGAGLADALSSVAEALREDRATQRLIDGELASARATARLVAGLPVFALAIGGGAGGDPWGFLFGTPGGLACLAVGLALEIAGLWWIEALCD